MPSPAIRNAARRRAYLWCSLGALPLLASNAAHAIPAYARQTGAACADCHAGSYGPALTPYGMRFKLNGYTDTDGKGFKLPAAVQLTETRTVPTQGDNTTRLSQADLYLAGRINDYLGGYVKVQSFNQGAGKFNTQLGDMDLRFVVKDLKLGGRDTTLGVTVNNNPGFQDPISALPGATANGPPAVPGAGTLLNPSSSNTLADRVIGASVYALYDANWYGEIGSYNALPTSLQDRFGYTLGGDPGRLSDTGYARFAYMRDLRRQFYSIGLVALTTKRQLPRIGPREGITDLGYDLTYQFLGNRENILQLAYVNIYERRRYAGVFVSPSVPGLVSLPRGVVHDQTLTLTYTFKQSYGLAYSHLISSGTHDAARFTPHGDPDTVSDSISLFWTPFGKDDSLTSIANLKLSATWFLFSKYNGSSDDIFGNAPPVTNAHDLNAFLLSASVAF